MSAEQALRILHVLSLFYMMFGLGAVMVPLWRGWRSEEPQQQLLAFEDASTGHQAALLPGAILSGATGLFYAAEKGYNFITTGWLLSLEAVYLFVLLICLPLLGSGLRRVRLEALNAAKAGQVTPELQDVLADNVPIVFSLLTALSIPVMAYLAIYRPY